MIPALAAAILVFPGNGWNQESVTVLDMDIQNANQHTLDVVIPGFAEDGVLNILKVVVDPQSFTGFGSGEVFPNGHVHWSPSLSLEVDLPGAINNPHELIYSYDECQILVDEEGPYTVEWDDCQTTSYTGFGGSWTPNLNEDWTLFGTFELDLIISLSGATAQVNGFDEAVHFEVRYDYYPADQDSNGTVDWQDLLIVLAGWGPEESHALMLKVLEGMTP